MHIDAAPTAHHHHTASLDACLDLINTVELTDGEPEDHVSTVDDVVAFLADHDLGHEGDLRRQARHEGDAWLARFRAAREAIRELWDAQVEARTPATEALDGVNALLDQSPRVELRATPAGVEVAHRHPDEDPTGEALARAATPLIEAIAAGHTDRFRICANDGCRWVFEDASRAGRRRWCDMSTCGNRAKVQRFRSKRRAAGAAPGNQAPDEG